MVNWKPIHTRVLGRDSERRQRKEDGEESGSQLELHDRCSFALVAVVPRMPFSEWLRGMPSPNACGSLDALLRVALWDALPNDFDLPWMPYPE